MINRGSELIVARKKEVGQHHGTIHQGCWPSNPIREHLF
jgi:hypothetical protein